MRKISLVMLCSCLGLLATGCELLFSYRNFQNLCDRNVRVDVYNDSSSEPDTYVLTPGEITACRYGSVPKVEATCDGWLWWPGTFKYYLYDRLTVVNASSTTATVTFKSGSMTLSVQDILPGAFARDTSASSAAVSNASIFTIDDFSSIVIISD